MNEPDEEFNPRVWVRELRDILTRLDSLAVEFRGMAHRLPHPAYLRRYPKAWAEDARYLTGRIELLIVEMLQALGIEEDDDDEG